MPISFSNFHNWFELILNVGIDTWKTTVSDKHQIELNVNWMETSRNQVFHPIVFRTLCYTSTKCFLGPLYFRSFNFSDGKNTNGKPIDLAMIPNLNWLIHMAFARQDYKYCNEVIEYQFSETYDHEYLYYIKVNIYRYTSISISMLCKPFNRRPRGALFGHFIWRAYHLSICLFIYLRIALWFSSHHLSHSVRIFLVFFSRSVACFVYHFYVSMV